MVSWIYSKGLNWQERIWKEIMTPRGGIPPRVALYYRTLYCTFLIQPNLSAILPVWIPVRVS